MNCILTSSKELEVYYTESQELVSVILPSILRLSLKYACRYHFYLKLLFSVLVSHHSSIFDVRYSTVNMHARIHKGVLCKRTSSYRFNEHQLSELKKRFKSDPYITGIEKELMAKNLGITQKAIKDWFYFKRSRLRQLLGSKYSNTTVVTAWQAQLETTCMCSLWNIHAYVLKLSYSMVIILCDILTVHQHIWNCKDHNSTV